MATALHSSREVRILKDLRGEIAGRDVLVVEDIVDTGHTLKPCPVVFWRRAGRAS